MISNITGTIQPGKHTVLQRNERNELYVQTFDAYGYQRELEIVREPAAWSRGHMAVYAYKHPFRPPAEFEVSRAIARRLLERIWGLSQEHTILLWNDTNERYAQHDGFVKFHDRLLSGCAPSVTLLP